jgi:hypothetical protein
MGYVNRDENAVNNMIKIVNTFIKDKTRPGGKMCIKVY